MEYEKLLGGSAEVGNALHCRSACPNDRYPLVVKLIQTPVSVSARVVIVPPAGVKGVPLVSADALYRR